MERNLNIVEHNVIVAGSPNVHDCWAPSGRVGSPWQGEIWFGKLVLRQFICQRGAARDVGASIVRDPYLTAGWRVIEECSSRVSYRRNVVVGNILEHEAGSHRSGRVIFCEPFS